MKKTTYICLALCLILSACGKNEVRPTTISGQALQYGTLEPIEGANVYLIASGGGDGNILTNDLSWTTLDSMLTDTEGRYAFERIISGAPYIVTELDDTRYAPQRDIIPVQKEGDNPIDLIFKPYAWFKIHLKNVNPHNTRDEIFLGGFGLGGGSDQNRFIGSSIDTTIIGEVEANKNINLKWIIYKENNDDMEENDSFYISAFDTIDYEILY